MFKKLFLLAVLLTGWCVSSFSFPVQISMQIIRSSILYQNSPNPFQNQTVIHFKLSEEARDASICIFDMQGKMLKTLPVTNGEESVIVNSSEFGDGLYLYSLIVNGQEVDTKKMVISK